MTRNKIYNFCKVGVVRTESEVGQMVDAFLTKITKDMNNPNGDWHDLQPISVSHSVTCKTVHVAGIFEECREYQITIVVIMAPVN